MHTLYKPGLASQLVVWTAALVSIGIGLAVLAGWHWNIHGLKNVIAGAVEMKVNAAAGIVCAGLALILKTRPSLAARLSGGMLALAVLLIGVLTLVEYLLNVDLGID